MSDPGEARDAGARGVPVAGEGATPLRPEPIRVPEWTWTRGASYEQAVAVGPLVLTCGVAPFDDAGEIVGRGDFEAQFRQVVANLGRILEAAGSGMDLIARQTVYLQRPKDLSFFCALRDELYAPPYPASIAVVVTAMAHPDMLVEIAVEAMRRTASSRAVAQESSRARLSTPPEPMTDAARPRPEVQPEARE